MQQDVLQAIGRLVSIRHDGYVELRPVCLCLSKKIRPDLGGARIQTQGLAQLTIGFRSCWTRHRCLQKCESFDE